MLKLSQNIIDIMRLLSHDEHESRIVGRAVRDSLLGLKPKDIDIATTMRPHDVITKLSNKGYKTFDLGIKFGTVCVLVEQELVEITTLRVEQTRLGSRHPNVEFITDFREDALRRDLTINSMSYCPFEDKIYDYFDGVDHLMSGTVKFVGDPELRIKEDPLRILRFFRFITIFKNSDTRSLQACIKHKDLLKNLPKERIKSEFDKILEARNLEVLEMMHESRVLNIILPSIEFQRDKFERLCSLNIKAERSVMYALLGVKEDSFFSRKEKKFIDELLNNKKSLRRIWLDHPERLDQFFLFMFSNNECSREEYLKLKNHEKVVFPVNGKMLLDQGIPCREIGLILDSMKDEFLKNLF